MPKTRQQKEDTVAKLTEKLGKARSVVFADYKGLTMGQLSNMRNQLAETGAEFTVTKNSLLGLALKTTNLSPVTHNPLLLQGPTATLFAYEEEINPIKILAKTLKEASMGSIKAGILNGEYLESFQVIKLSQLPSKDELRAKIVGGLGAPLYGLVGVLQGNIRNLVYAIDQIRIQKGGE